MNTSAAQLSKQEIDNMYISVDYLFKELARASSNEASRKRAWHRFQIHLDVHTLSIPCVHFLREQPLHFWDGRPEGLGKEEILDHSVNGVVLFAGGELVAVWSNDFDGAVRQMTSQHRRWKSVNFRSYFGIRRHEGRNSKHVSLEGFAVPSRRQGVMLDTKINFTPQTRPQDGIGTGLTSLASL